MVDLSGCSIAIGHEALLQKSNKNIEKPDGVPI
jgi:hypothetical protein